MVRHIIKPLVGAAFVGTSALALAGGAQAATPASAHLSINPTVSGQTLHYALNVTGNQHQYADESGKLFTNPESGSTRIDFGDGTAPAGTDGGAEVCKPSSSVHPFALHLRPETHTYAKPGTYTVTAKVYYCGDKGETAVTKSYKVTVQGAAKAPRTVAGAPVAGGHKSAAVNPPAVKAPATQHPMTKPAAAGPKVETDNVTTNHGSSDAGLAVALLGTGVAVAGGFALRRRQA